jgi:hypothetical protein
VGRNRNDKLADALLILGDSGAIKKWHASSNQANKI